MMARTQSVRTELLGGPAIEGDQVAIRWRFPCNRKVGFADQGLCPMSAGG